MVADECTAGFVDDGRVCTQFARRRHVAPVVFPSVCLSTHSGVGRRRRLLLGGHLVSRSLWRQATADEVCLRSSAVDRIRSVLWAAGEEPYFSRQRKVIGSASVASVMCTYVQDIAKLRVTCG